MSTIRDPAFVGQASACLPGCGEAGQGLPYKTDPGRRPGAGGMSIATHVETAVAARFDLLESRFRAEVASDDFRVRAILRALGPVEGRNVLDFGCGKGRFARRLIERGAHVVGVDPSRGMLAVARAGGARRGSRHRPPAPLRR